MWGTTSFCDELTDDFGGPFEGTSIDNCRLFGRLAGIQSHGVLGLLQQYRVNSGKHLLSLSFLGFDPTVWTGRAVQAECEQMEGVGLAHLYPALAWSVCAPGHHGYPRAPDLILGKALRGRLGHQITGTTARPFLHFLNPTRRPRRVSSRLVS